MSEPDALDGFVGGIVAADLVRAGDWTVRSVHLPVVTLTHDSLPDHHIYLTIEVRKDPF